MIINYPRLRLFRETIGEWVETAMPTNAYRPYICYGNGKFVALINATTAAYSEDGINWTKTNMPSTGDVYTKWPVCYGNGKFVAASDTEGIAAYSEDGINWTKTAMPVSDDWRSVCYGNGKFVAIAQYSNNAAYSEDGINWVKVSLPKSIGWWSICYGNRKFVIVSRSSNVSIYSADGINWSELSMPVSTDWYSVCYGNGKFVAVAENTTVAAYWMQKKVIKNLLPWPYSVAVGDFVTAGTTYTIYPDGRIHVGGKPTSYNDLGIIRGDAGAKLAKAIEGKTISIGFLNGKAVVSNYVFYFAITKANGTTIVLVNHYDDDSMAMFKENIDLSQYGELATVYLTIKRRNDVNFDLMLYPMINEGPKALPFVSPAET